MIEWTCVTCLFPIADDEGVVSVPLSHISDMPMFGPEWAPRHHLCREAGESYYEVPVEQLRDAEGVLRWTAHLLGKVWIANSNWDAIIRSTLKEAKYPCG